MCNFWVCIVYVLLCQHVTAKVTTDTKVTTNTKVIAFQGDCMPR